MTGIQRQKGAFKRSPFFVSAKQETSQTEAVRKAASLFRRPFYYNKRTKAKPAGSTMYIQEKPYIPFAAAMIFAALPLALLMVHLKRGFKGAK